MAEETGGLQMEQQDLVKEIEDLRRRVRELEDIRLRLENSERALRDSEERFRTVFEQGPLGMSILRPNLERVAINAKLTEMFGYTKEELRDLTFLDLTRPDDLDLTRERLGTDV